MERVEVDGLTIAYERAGTGAPVVLLHGYVGDGPSVWRHQIDALSDEYTVVAWNTPGANGSSDPPETFGIDGYAECLAGFIDVLQLGPAHIIGLSFGGALGIALQRQHRSLTTSLVLASAYAGWRGSLDREVVEQRLTQAYSLSERPAREVVEALLPTMFALPVPEADVNAFRAAVAAVHPAGFRAMASASAEDLRDVPPTIDVPTLLIYGDKDERAPLHVAQQLRATITGSRLVTLRDAGHVCNVELPERFNDEVRQFLADVGEPDGVRP